MLSEQRTGTEYCYRTEARMNKSQTKCNPQNRVHQTHIIIQIIFPVKNKICPDDMKRPIADQNNKSKPSHNLCSIFSRLQVRICCLLRYRTRILNKMVGRHNVREGNHTQWKYTGHQEFKYNYIFIIGYTFSCRGRNKTYEF